ncbi:unnamed protein product [Caenorhabditis sp. 36 PRJEB53466]|nr:unnamed protein product [Caenorhabditis sp. 36 PRJEB53466]
MMSQQPEAPTTARVIVVQPVRGPRQATDPADLAPRVAVPDEPQPQPVVEADPASLPNYYGPNSVRGNATRTVMPKHVNLKVPHLAFCPYCQKTVTTYVVRYAGCWTWTLCFLGLFGLFPLLLVFWMDFFKDFHHNCPDCKRRIAYSVR